MGLVIFNGVSSEDLNATVQHPPEYAVPKRDYEVTHVPGRNGDVIVESNSYENVEREYNLAIVKPRTGSYTETVGRVIRWLHSAKGYSRLEDSYEPDYYRLAYFQDAVTVSNINMTAGEVNVSFICKPQRFLKKGEKAISISGVNSGYVEIYNPTGFDSKPLVYINSGKGTLYFCDENYNVIYSVIVSNADGLFVDCDLEDAYGLSSNGMIDNLNSTISLDEFPKFSPGKNYIKCDGTISDIVVVPNWWTL